MNLGQQIVIGWIRPLGRSDTHIKDVSWIRKGAHKTLPLEEELLMVDDF